MKESFGNRLKRIREAAGLTQRQLANAAQVTQNDVAQWEAGTREPTYSALQALINTLRVESREFFEPPPEGGPLVASSEAPAAIEKPRPRLPVVVPPNRGRPAPKPGGRSDYPRERKPMVVKNRNRPPRG